jgi:hypothetical protein
LNTAIALFEIAENALPEGIELITDYPQPPFA